MKRGVFIFLLFLFPLLFSCSSSDGNSSSGGVRHVYEQSSSAAKITGIEIPSNYIELLKEKGVDLHYNISAVARPKNAVDKSLQYTSSDPNIAEVSSNGIVTVKDFGVFNVEIISEARQDISQKVTFLVRENIKTDLDIENNPLSFFGAYSIIQYGINKEPDTNIGGSFSVNVDRTSEGGGANVELLFNGLELPIEINDDLSTLSYENAGKFLFKHFNGRIINNNEMVIQLKADDYVSLIENDIIKAGETLYLSLKKDYDLSPYIKQDKVITAVTDIQVQDALSIDRSIKANDTLSPVVLPVNASNRAVTYSTNDKNIASVSPAGIVTALDEGSTDIIVTSVSNNEVVGITKVTVIDSNAVRVNKIVFDKMDTNIYIGTPVTVKATVYPANATYKDIVYISKNPSIATVNSATGIVTPRRKGTVEIVAKSDKGSCEETIKLNVNVYTFPVTAITNIPEEINMAVSNQLTIKPEVFPSYADDTNLVYTADSSGNISVNKDGVITANKTGKGTVTVSSEKYPNTKKDITVNIRQDQEKRYITSINLDNEPPSTLYINHTEYIMTPSYEPANANIDTSITVKADNNSLVTIMPLGNDSYSILPQAEGKVTVTVKSKNGVKKDVLFNIKKVMNVKGYYTIDKVEYSLADKRETFTPEKDKLQGEFAINLLDDKYQVQGRLQYTPANPLVSYTFNNWRYIYENKEIMLDTADKFANQTKDALSAQNIKVTGANTIEYTYTQDSFKAVIYLTKVNNEVKEILDRTMYLTPVNMQTDPHSAEGYYEMTWFYGNSFNNAWLERYPAIYSTSKSEMPTSSKIGTTYHTECPKMTGWAACYKGGNGDSGSVAYYKGAFAVNVDGTEEKAGLSSIMKVQTQGHQNYNLQSWAKFIHASFSLNSLKIPQNQANNGEILNKNTQATINTANSNEGTKNAAISYTWLDNNVMQYEVFFKLNYEYRFMYRAVKVSDRYIDLPTDKFVSGDVSDREPPEVPDLAKIVPIEEFAGTVTAIE